MKKIVLVLLMLMICAMLPTGRADASILMDGSTTFSHGNFDGIVYWRVYSPEDSSSPLGAISDYSYFYQIHNVGTRPITEFGVDNPFGDAITSGGYLANFNLAGLHGTVPPNFDEFGGDIGSGLWNFSGIGKGKDSDLLYFTSPGDPILVDGGLQGGPDNDEGQVPGPAPEPATLAMLGLGLCGFCGRIIRRKFTA